MVINTPAPILSMTGGQSLGSSGTFKYTLHDLPPVISVGIFTNTDTDTCGNTVTKTDMIYSLTGGPAGFVTGSVRSYPLDRSKAVGPYPQIINLHLEVSNFSSGASVSYDYSFILYDCDNDLIAPTTYPWTTPTSINDARLGYYQIEEGTGTKTL